MQTKFGQRGKFAQLVERADKIVGLRTADGLTHRADLLIVAAGGWTPSLVKEADQLLDWQRFDCADPGESA